MSAAARDRARRISGLSIAAKAVLMALADHADAEGKAWPKQKTLAEITCMTDRSVRRQIVKLEELGLLTREERFRPDGRGPPPRAGSRVRAVPDLAPGLV